MHVINCWPVMFRDIPEHRGEVRWSPGVQEHHDHGRVTFMLGRSIRSVFFRDLFAISLEPLCSELSQMVHLRRQDPTLQLGSSTGGLTEI